MAEKNAPAARGALVYLKKPCGESFQRTALIETVSTEDSEVFHETAYEDEGLAAVNAEAAFEPILAHLDCERSKRMLRMGMNAQDGNAGRVDAGRDRRPKRH